MQAYVALAANVDAFFDAASSRGADLACGSGCVACCQVELTLCAVEAEAARRAVDSLSPDQRADLGATTCVMLDRQGACAIYVGRPLVCRSQGLPLAYPGGVLPEESVRGTVGDQDLTWCPLNFTVKAPQGGSVFDAGRADEALAQINRAYCLEQGVDPMQRVSMRSVLDSSV